MRDAKAELDAREIEVVVVGNGTPGHARAFAEDEQVPFTLWVDPEMKAYRAAGLRRGMGSVLTRRSLEHGWRALKGGFRQTRTKGDPWQNGGAFLITRQGELLLSQVSDEAGDHVTLAEVLAALDRHAA